MTTSRNTVAVAIAPCLLVKYWSFVDFISMSIPSPYDYCLVFLSTHMKLKQMLCSSRKSSTSSFVCLLLSCFTKGPFVFITPYRKIMTYDVLIQVHIPKVMLMISVEIIFIFSFRHRYLHTLALYRRPISKQHKSKT